MNNLPPWMDPAEDKRNQNRRSRRQERGHARETGGRQVTGSGSSWRARGDVKSDDYLDELKYTDASSYRIVAEVFERLIRDANTQGRTARMVVEFPGRNLKLYITEADDS